MIHVCKFCNGLHKLEYEIYLNHRNVQFIITLRHLLKTSLALGKSPACKQLMPHADHTPVGSRPHFVDTSTANESLSSSISLSLSLLKISKSKSKPGQI